MRLSIILTLAMVATTGCHLKEVPVDPASRHGEVAWRDDFPAASRDAALLSKPMLLVMVAGPKDDGC
ncbi:MAG TPA: hypothetical protein VFF73_07045 [Planctomycetota bacterium]|nr:hypothetical protein [Planctomycetota bacterium]